MSCNQVTVTPPLIETFPEALELGNMLVESDEARNVGVLSAYGPHLRVRVCFDGPDGVSLTKQSMKAETDINNILKRYAKTGSLTHLAANPGTFTDVSEMGDYRSALEQVKLAESSFAALPSRVRARFNNDAAQFLDFMLKPGNEAELKDLGLWAEGKASEPAKAEPPPIDPSPLGGGSVRDPETGRYV